MYTEEQKKAIKDLETEMQGKYLTEKWLGKILRVLYPTNNWVHDKVLGINVTPLKFRPDYCCPELKICVEFDGPDHYTKANVIRADLNKNVALTSLGYKVVRIPYFIQLNTSIIKLLFNIDVDFDYNFKHGFISKTVVLPSNFCEWGIWKFKDDLFKFSFDDPNVKEEIQESLFNKIKSFTAVPEELAKLYVAPSSLFLDLGLSNIDYESENIKIITSGTLKNRWNCVILEKARVLSNINNLYNISYEYNKKGNISAMLFYMTDGFTTYHHKLSFEKIKDSVTITLFINNKVTNKRTFPSNSMNTFNLIEFIYED